MKKILLYILSPLFVASVTFYCSSSQSNPNTVQKVIIIRHGEKPEVGDNLSCQGFNRALALADVLHQKIGVPNVIFVPSINMGKKTRVARMYQTIVPFAVKYGVDINTKYDVDDVDALANGIRKQSGTVLLVWEHKKIDNIVKALGVNNADKWNDNDYDSIWIIDYKNGSATLKKDKENINPLSNCH